MDFQGAMLNGIPLEPTALEPVALEQQRTAGSTVADGVGEVAGGIGEMLVSDSVAATSAICDTVAEAAGTVVAETICDAVAEGVGASIMETIGEIIGELLGGL